MDWQQFITPFTLSLFILIGALELLIPAREHSPLFARRWSLHLFLWLALGFFSSLFYRAGAVAFAASMGGTFPLLPFLLLYDFTRWIHHFLYHRVHALWIWHAAHHSDPDVDVSTSFRSHPIESLTNRLILFALIYLLHPDPNAIVTIQFISMGFNLFVHSNIEIPARLDAMLNWLIITPSLHRTHHSVSIDHQNSNFGNVFTFWDRMFNTFRSAVKHPTLGIAGLPAVLTTHPLFLFVQLPRREWTNSQPSEPAQSALATPQSPVAR